MNTVTKQLTMHQALNMALDHALAKDNNVVLYGQDIASCGGVFRITDGLVTKYGAKRVFNTPLSESLMAGMAVGMALHGLKPICEMQFMGFAYTTLDQMINHISRLYHRSKGQAQANIVFRIPFGGQIPAPEHHADSYEQLFATIPGLHVISPSDSQAAYSLLSASIQHAEPTVVLEPICRYHQRAYVDTTATYALTKARTLEKGNDITIISWGGMVTTVTQAIAELTTTIDCEHIDLVALNPIDTATLLASVRKTRRLLIVQDAHSNCSVASEISATITEHLFGQLTQPVKRLTAPNRIQPPFRYRNQYCPQQKTIQQTIEDMTKI